MQTFLPYSDCYRSAECLDNRRLGKQRVEGFQIIETILYGGAWHNHPAVRMWKQNLSGLAFYVEATCITWVRRGFRDTILDKLTVTGVESDMPSWFGDDRIHASHRSNLLRKSQYYTRFGWKEPNNLPYWWPV